MALYDLHTGRSFLSGTQPPAWILGLCVARDGKTLASASGDGTIKLWNVATRELLVVLAGLQTYLDWFESKSAFFLK